MIKVRTSISNGSIAAGGTVQDVCAANAGRNYFEFQNTSDTVMRIQFGTTDASASSGFSVAAGATWRSTSNFCPNGRVSVFCATTGKTYSFIQV